MAELSEIVTEVVEDAAEGVANGATMVAEAARETQPSLVGAGLIGFGIGFAGGFLVGGLYVSKRLRTHYERMAEDEVTKMREYYRAKEVVRENKPPLAEVVEEAGYVSTAKDPGTPNTAVAENTGPIPSPAPPVEQNVFTEPDLGTKDASNGWDYKTEIAARSEDRPYVIHEDEQHEKEYNEVTLTYYEGDDVLADSEDKIIENRDEVVGDFMNKFGHGCSDPAVVYVRNDALAAEFEICHSSDSYGHAVHGFQHSDESFQPMRRKPHDE